MIRQTFKILFVAKSSRISKNGETPIILRLTVNGVRYETSLNLKVDFANWCSKAEKSLGKRPIDKEINLRIDTIRVKLMQIYRDMEQNDEEINAKKIIDHFLGRDVKPVVMLLDVFHEHNERCLQLSEKDMAPATVVRYETSYKHTAEFIKHTYGKEDIPIKDVNHKFITDYEFYLKTVRKCNHNTTTKYLKNFKKIILIALTNNIISVDPFAKIKFKLDDVDRDFLESEELQRVIEKEIVMPRLAHIRDIFVFCCFTGLAFSDVKGLKEEHLVTDNTGRKWIMKKRQKTKNMCNIPLLDIPLQILEHYKNDAECIKKGLLLPVPSNVKMNAYLKEIADICGIHKAITTHVARHTFATTVALANNVSLDNVAKMLGHSDTKMTRLYARVLNKSILRDMINVEQNFSFTKK